MGNCVKSFLGMLKKAASSVLAILPCSRTESTLRASKGLRPCWTDFFEHSLPLPLFGSSRAFICNGSEIFNSPFLAQNVWIGVFSDSLGPSASTWRSVKFMATNSAHPLTDFSPIRRPNEFRVIKKDGSVDDISSVLDQPPCQ